jgi:hypothetical protein
VSRGNTGSDDDADFWHDTAETTYKTFYNFDEAFLYDVFCRIIAAEVDVTGRSIDGFHLRSRDNREDRSIVITTGLGHEIIYEWDGTIEDAIRFVVDAAITVRYDLGYFSFPPTSSNDESVGDQRVWVFDGEPLDRLGTGLTGLLDDYDKALLCDVFRRVVTGDAGSSTHSVEDFRIETRSVSGTNELVVGQQPSHVSVLEWDGTIEAAIRGVVGAAVSKRRELG